MRKLKRLSLVVVALLFSTMMASSQKPNIHILATGGAIAGIGGLATSTNHAAGRVAVGTLLGAVPEPKNIANVTGEQIARIGSQDTDDEIWLILAKKINQLLKRPDIDGIVITHGTDTMEETAYFLNLTVKSDKPIVLIGTMRPSIALSTDGSLSLYNVIITAGVEEPIGEGVLVTMDGLILGVESVLKMNTIDAQTFRALNSGALDHTFDGKVFYNQAPLKKHTTWSMFDITNPNSLPKVGIIYSYSNIEADMVIPLLHHDYKGIIHAGIDNGNIHKNIFPVLTGARKKGIFVIRSSRIPTGPATLDAEVDDVQYQFIASQKLNPRRSRVLLTFVLTKTNDWKQVQQYFNEH